MKGGSIILVLLLFAGCKEISFENPQPEGKHALREIPRKLQGRYLLPDDEGKLANDTLIVHANGYRFGYFDAAERDSDDSEVLSDSLVIKYYKRYYFLNSLDGAGPEWHLRVFRAEKNGDITMMAPERRNISFNDYLKQLNREIKIDSFLVNEQMIYRIDPTPKQLIDLIRKGYFSETRLVKQK